MPQLIRDDISLYYEVKGEGEPLLLIAGLASDSQSWQPILSDLTAQYQVVIYDNRGVGRTLPHSAASSIQKMADDAIALLDHLGMASTTIIGHSMGGMIAQHLASHYPHRVNRLILLATAAQNSARNNQLFHDWLDYWRAGLPPDLWFKNVFYWIFSSDFFNSSESVQQAVAYAISYPYPQSLEGFERQVTALLHANLTGQLSSIHQPTLIVYAENDLVFPANEVLTGLIQISHHHCVMIEKSGHSLVVEKPTAVAQIILKFLASHSRLRG